MAHSWATRFCISRHTGPAGTAGELVGQHSIPHYTASDNIHNYANMRIQLGAFRSTLCIEIMFGGATQPLALSRKDSYTRSRAAC